MMPAIDVSPEVRARLTEVMAARGRETGCAVTFDEAVRVLLEKGNPTVAEVNETTQRQCDRCGAQSAPAPKGTVPDGWLSRLELHTPAGVVFNDLCPACGVLPVAQAVILPEGAA